MTAEEAIKILEALPKDQEIRIMFSDCNPMKDPFEKEKVYHLPLLLHDNGVFQVPEESMYDYRLMDVDDYETLFDGWERS